MQTYRLAIHPQMQTYRLVGDSMTTATELAILTERLKTHMAASDRMADATATAQHEAQEDRAAMMRAIAGLAHAIEKINADINQIKPVTDMVTSLRSSLTGMAIVLGVIGTIAWGAVMFFKEKLLAVFG